MGAHIDLSWLAQLLTQTPSTQNSANPPDMDPGSVGKYINTDPNADFSGKNDADTTQPYVTPTRWQQVFWPTQSNQINQLNNQANAALPEAQAANNATMGVRRQNIARMPIGSLPSGMTPDQLAEMNYGTGQDPTTLRQENATLGYMKNGGTPLDTSVMHNTASAQVEEAANRARVAALAGTLGNPEAEAIVQNKGLTYQGGEYGGLTALQPSTFERMGTENRLGTAEARSRLSLLPGQTELGHLQLGEQIPLAEKRLSLLPYTERTMGNEAVGEAAASGYQPVQPLFGNRIDEGAGTVTPKQVNPMGMSTAQQEVAGIKMLSGNTPKTITIGGKTYPVMSPTGVNQPIDALGRSGINPPLNAVGGGTNNVTKSATPSSESGKMNPPIPAASSNTTLSPTKNPINPALVQPEPPHNAEEELAQQESNNKEPVGMESARMNAPHIASVNFHNIIGKYAKEYQGGSDFGFTFNKQDATDVLAKHAKEMSHDDLKQAMRLLHNLPD